MIDHSPAMVLRKVRKVRGLAEVSKRLGEGEKAAW